jgi:hypothetical protein
VARMSINRRRQNTGISMKKRFKGKFPVHWLEVLLVVV